MRKSMMRIAGFLLLLGIVLWKTDSVLSFKFGEGNTIMTDFYRLEKNTVDVVTIGSSHAYVNFNNGTLWDEYGIAAYNLCSSRQPMWNSYYYLKEALKTQSPELIVLEGYGTVLDGDYNDGGTVVKNTYGMRWSADRIEAIRVSVPEEDQMKFLLGYARYHTRYASLNRGDFFPESEYLGSNKYWHYTDTMGQYLWDQPNPVELGDVSGVRKSADLSAKTEEYYRKTIELARERGIPIVVIVAPHDPTKKAQQRYLRAEEIAAEYGVSFLNCNLCRDEIGFDYSADYHDTSHMTASGSKKFSHYIGKYLKDNFEISDRRGDARYAAWDRCAAYTEQYLQNQILKNSSDLGQISDLLANPNYRILISADGDASPWDGETGTFLSMQGIDPDPQKTMWMREGGALVWDSGSGEAQHYISTELHDICLRNGAFSADGSGNQIIVDNEPYRKVQNGLNVVVFDTLTDRVADSFGIDKDNDCQVVR